MISKTSFMISSRKNQIMLMSQLSKLLVKSRSPQKDDYRVHFPNGFRILFISPKTSNLTRTTMTTVSKLLKAFSAHCLLI